MATNNFYFENMLIAISEEDVQSFFAYDEDNLQLDLKYEIPNGVIVDEYEKDALRSYGGRVIFRVHVYVRELEYQAVEVVCRGGYYSGLNLDYKVSEGDCHWSILDKKMPTKAADKKVVSICKKIEKICGEYGVALRKVGQFCNGEAVYEKVK